ncbi:hypothetical protein JB92DRAFT_2954126 [Gautieria morchelliformis]|nr:hypothetical protein JB92DRAFT_2954126 [Gautieria morchelliformis]
MQSELVPSAFSLQSCESRISGAGCTCIVQLPLEIIEAILSILPLPAVSAFAQTCKTYRSLVYNPIDNHLWRTLFLNQEEYDDPRLVLGQEAHISWDSLLKQWTAVSKVLHAHAPLYTIEVLRTLIQMAEYARPAKQSLQFDSRNLEHLRTLLRSSGFFSQTVHTSGQEGLDPDSDVELAHMVSRLKLYAGLEAIVSTPSRRLHARSIVYDLRNYHKGNDYGPFIPDGGGRVHWKHLYAIHEVIALNIMDFAESDQGLPMSMRHIQPQSIPRSESADARDWAGLEGKWQVIFCFCDHRDLLAFNRQHTMHATPNPSVFQEEDFEEALRFLEFELSLVTAEEPSETIPHCPARPTLHFLGKISGNARVKGRVYMTPDEQVRWSFMSGEPGQTIWSTEAIQVGGIASAFGALGAWTTVFHDVDDPVGPMWLWKLPD